MMKWLKSLLSALNNCKCPSCGGWMHAEDCGKLIAVSEMHWPYRCNCDFDSAWWLGAPVPIYDDGRYGDKYT